MPPKKISKKAPGFFPPGHYVFPAEDVVNGRLDRAERQRLRVFTCTDFEGHWPAGTSAVVVADDEKKAKTILSKWLRANGLSASGFTLTELDLRSPHALILQDGQY